ncbi:macro domain-containing protein [Nostoc punctiforme UO1]|uniref:macro domain-containing protein n=1 Tax=Nostoc punctiforme TaxID=272131 RepID=UPI00309D25B7
MNNKITGAKIYFTLFKKLGLKQFAISFSSYFGAFWLFIEPASFFIPEHLKFGLSGYFGLVLISLGFAVVQNFPQISASCSLSSPNTDIEVKIGDIFLEDKHLVIGFNDVFDTELGEIIRDSSVQGQFIKQVYRGKQDNLDADIETALQEHNSHRRHEPGKTRGKVWRYPIGTTITLGSYEKRYFLTAYGYMKNDLTVESNSDYILTSLDKLWQEVRRKCHGTDVAIPIIGSDLARSGLSRMQLSKLIITSFAQESKRRFITRKVTLMIYPKDLESVDFYELNNFLKSICF